MVLLKSVCVCIDVNMRTCRQERSGYGLKMMCLCQFTRGTIKKASSEESYRLYWPVGLSVCHFVDY